MSGGNGRRPGRAELDTARQAARRMLERGLDPHRLALAFTYLDERNAGLERTLARLDHYLRFGMNEHDLAELTREVEQLRERTPPGERSLPNVWRPG